MGISKQEIEKLCSLAKLRFSEGDLEKISEETEEIIKFADTINNTVCGNTEEIKSTADNVVSYETLRDDIVEASLENEKILLNVDGENGFFAVMQCVK